MEGVATIWMVGASSGIGRAVARRLLGQGCRVALSARSADKLAAVTEGLDEVAAGRAMPLPVDATDVEAVREAYAALKADWGTPDMLFYCAGVWEPAHCKDLSYEVFKQTVEVNLLGLAACVTTVLPDMLARGFGRVAGVGSLSSYRGLPLAGAYGASKAALNNFLETLRFDVEDMGVSVVQINPGFVRTALTEKNDFEMPYLIEVDQAADYIMRGLAEGVREIHFPPAFSWRVKFARILPFPVYHWLIKRVTASGGKGA